MSKRKIPLGAAFIVAGLFLVMPTAALKNPLLSALDQAAKDYVKLSLSIDRYDPIYIDAYYGPPEWKLEPAAINARWKLFERILSEPWVPSMLK